jgi:hypothetical protein
VYTNDKEGSRQLCEVPSGLRAHAACVVAAAYRAVGIGEVLRCGGTEGTSCCLACAASSLPPAPWLAACVTPGAHGMPQQVMNNTWPCWRTSAQHT